MSSVPRSVCPVCLTPIPADLETVGQDTYLVKECPEHGAFRTIVWRGHPSHQEWARTKIPSRPKTPFTKRDKGCPLDCGLCEGHGQHTCTAVLEITWKCDLGCPVCFASSGKKAPADPTVEKIAYLLDRVLLASGQCNLQLSGGEPTTRADLPDLITLAKFKKFPFVQLNTNGIRLGHDPQYAQTLANAGLDSVFLQFDGLNDQFYTALRGKPLLEIKLAAVRNLTAAGIGIVLVPTVVPGVNDSGLGDILKFAANNSPAVRGVHFQPVSYFGRYPEAPSDEQRITLPDVMRRLEDQTNGMVKTTDFLPPGCEHSHCSFHGNYVVSEDGGLQKLGSSGSCGCAPQPASKGADQAKSFVRQQWSAPKRGMDLNELMTQDDMDAFIARASSHKLAVSAMAFQDAWTLDLERLQGCCIHEVSPDGRLIPFCAYNLTSMNGDTLYRGKYDGDDQP